MLRKKIIFIFFTLILFLHIDGFTQPGPDPCADPGSPCYIACGGDCSSTNDECLACLSNTQVPLDGGLLWLLLAGAGYGVKKIVDHRKKKG